MLKSSAPFKQANTKSVVDEINYDMLIEYGIIDPKAMNPQNFSIDSTAYPFSNDDDGQSYDLKRVVTTAKKPFTKQFVSFEQDFFRLGDPNLCFFDGANKSLNQGFVSNAVCSAQADFATPQKIKFTFNSEIEIYGLTLCFDEISGIYPKKFSISTKNKGVPLYTNEYGCAETRMEIIPAEEGREGFGKFDELTVEFITMNRANVRARLSKIIFGVICEFDNKNLTDVFTCEFDMDATGRRQTQQKMSFSIYDPKDEYDMENPKGKYRYLTESQPITARLKAECAGETEEFPVCEMVLTGQVEDKGNILTFNAVSYLQSAVKKVDLSDTLEESKNLSALNGGGLPLCKALRRVLRQMDLPLMDDAQNRWEISGVPSTNIVVDLKDIALKDCVQMLAQASNCVVFEDAAGKIHIKPRSEITPADPLPHYTFDTMYDIPRLNKYPPLGKVVINRNGEEAVESADEWNHTEGQVQTVSNKVIDGLDFDQTALEKIANHQAKELSLRNEYTVSIRGGIELTPFDCITAETKYQRDSVIEGSDEQEAKNRQRAYVSKKTMKYNGAVNSELKFFMEPESSTED